jgi:hypothetical protein
LDFVNIGLYLTAKINKDSNVLKEKVRQGKQETQRTGSSWVPQESLIPEVFELHFLKGVKKK